jgi:O-methyltransferase
MTTTRTQSTWLGRAIQPDKPLGNLLLRLRAHTELAMWRPRNREDEEIKAAVSRIAPAFTMVGVTRLRRLVEHASTLTTERIEGAIVECGTWRGGSLALLSWAFRRSGDPRELWAFDSFEGVPPPGPNDPPSAHRGFSEGWCAATATDVKAAIRSLGGDDAAVRIVPGWLEHTLPRADVGRIALLNVDVDWYDSVMVVLDHLYDRLVPGGIINFDDYGRWSGCDRAVDDFAKRRGLQLTIHRTGRHGAWIRVTNRTPSPQQRPL